MNPLAKAIYAILDEYEISEGVYDERSIIAIDSYLHDTRREYQFTDVEKDDCTGGTFVVCILDEDRIQLYEWEYRR